MFIVLYTRGSSKQYCKKKGEAAEKSTGGIFLLDLDSSKLEVSLDLEAGDVVGVAAVSKWSEALTIDENLKAFIRTESNL